VLLAAGLRLHAVVTANLWLDEYWTMELACGRDTTHMHLPVNVLLPSLPSLSSLADARPWWTIPGSLSQVTHPPLFFLLLRGWWALLGGSDIAARLLPWTASMTAVVLMYFVARRINGPKAALWAALLMAISGQQIFYAQEIRSYSLIVALGLGALAALIDIERRGASVRRLAVLAALTYALLMTHYFTVGLLAAFVVYAAIRLPRRDTVRVALAFAVAAAAFAVTWGPFMLKQHAAMGLETVGGAAFLLEHSPHHVAHAFARLLAVPAQPLAPASYMNPAGIPPKLAWVGLPLFLAPLFWIRRRPDLLVWYLWVAGVVTPLLALDLSRSSMHLAFPRYTLLAAPGIFAVFAAGYEWIKGLWQYVPPAVVTLVCARLLPASLQQPQTKDDWQPIATIAAQSMGPDGALVVTAPPGWERATYLYVAHYLGPVNRPVAILNVPASPQLLAELHAHSPVWVINGWRGAPPVFGPGRLRPLASDKVGDFGQLEWPQ
jgi:4-amino-4-deoxy-L-arabinose transferase-like glycosyltransferase